DYTSDTRRLRDSIVAIKLLPEEHTRPLHELVRCLRDLELLARVAEDAQFPQSGSELRRYRNRSLAIPDLFPIGSAIATERNGQSGGASDEDRRKAAQAALDRYVGLTSAIHELTTLNSPLKRPQFERTSAAGRRV
ncbi:MAG: hypothetical protein ND807_10750, partial [Vicinamibacterales bacterium]|nr:hypothetical protein [Vicinamibacterales bacterium]